VLDPNDGSTVILQNSGNCLSSDTASHPKNLSLQQHCWENLKFCMKLRLH